MEAARRRGRHLDGGMVAWITAASDLCTWVYFARLQMMEEGGSGTDTGFVSVREGWSSSETGKITMSGITQLLKITEQKDKSQCSQ